MALAVAAQAARHERSASRLQQEQVSGSAIGAESVQLSLDLDNKQTEDKKKIRSGKRSAKKDPSTSTPASVKPPHAPVCAAVF